MKEKILKNCKKYWYVIGILIIAFITVGFIVLNKEPDYLVLKKNTFKVELGTPFNIKPETYLNTEKLDTDVKKDVLENAKVTVDKDLNNIENFCLDVGKYKVTVSYKNEKETFTYKVEDTTAPVITGAESIDIVQGTDLSTYDFKVLYTVDDLSQTDVKYDTSTIDVNTIGTYTLKIISEDDYGNKSNKEAVVNIVAPLSADEVIVEETIPNADGTTTKRVVTRKKIETQNGDSRIVISGDTSKSSNNNSYSSSSNSSNSNLNNKPSGSTSSNSSSNDNFSTTKPNNGSSSNTNSNNSSSNGSTNTKPNNSGSSSNNSSSGGGNITEPVKPPKVTIYWAECHRCGKHIESNISSNDAINQLLSSACSNSAVGKHTSYSYGGYQK